MARRTKPRTQTVDAAPSAATTAVGLAFRDRIVGFERVKASELKRNAKNWRTHPESQKGALSGILKDIGFVGAVVVRKVEGGLELLDGHLRSNLAGDELIPVLVTDLNDAEAEKVLLTYDPITAMAKADEEKLAALLKTVDADDNAELRRLMADLADQLEAEEEEKKGSEDDFEVAGMELQAHEHYDYVVVLASTTHEWNVLCDKLALTPEKRRSRMGIGHAIRAEKLLALIEKKK